MKLCVQLSAEKLYLVALSGGADSVALTMVMKEMGLRLRALHCNFHLRGAESDRDEAFVRLFCEQQQIPLEVCHFETRRLAQEHKVSIEMEARNLRYEWFRQKADELGAEAVCVAHHQDDQAETLLLNLLRGTGLAGLTAMHADRVVDGLRILRPLLAANKEEIHSYLKEKGQTFVTDSTNLERDALRNRIRLDVMPLLQELNPNITACLARTAENVKMELDKDSNESRYFHWLTPMGFSRSQILDIYAHRPEASPCTSGLQWHSATHSLVLNRGEWVLRERRTQGGDITPSLITELMPADFLPGKQDFLLKTQAFVDADCISGELVLRPLRRGERFRPYGMKRGSQLVSDFLTNRKVNLLDKQSQLVVADSASDNIVWLVGREIDQRFCITPSTRSILRLSITCQNPTSSHSAQ